MTDTVTRLMAKVHAIENLAALAADPMNSESEQDEYVNELVERRQALEAELTRLFTPLSDEQIDNACESLGFGGLSWTAIARATEKAHGIGVKK